MEGVHLGCLSALLPAAGLLWTAKRYKIDHMWGEAVRGVDRACTLKQRSHNRHGLARRAVHANFKTYDGPCAL